MANSSSPLWLIIQQELALTTDLLIFTPVAMRNPLTVVGALKPPEGVLSLKIQLKNYTVSKFYTKGIK